MQETAVRHCEWERVSIQLFSTASAFTEWPVIASSLSPGIAVPAIWATPRLPISPDLGKLPHAAG
jgi:hypothetical protein